MELVTEMANGERKQDKTTNSKKLANWIRHRLERFNPEVEGDVSAVERMINNMVRIATNTDEGHMKEAVWAFSALMERTYGKPLKDDSELEAMSKAGTVFVLCKEPVITVENPVMKLPEARPDFDEDR